MIFSIICSATLLKASHPLTRADGFDHVEVVQLGVVKPPGRGQHRRLPRQLLATDQTL